MCFQSQSPHKAVNLVRIPNKNTFSRAEIVERRFDRVLKRRRGVDGQVKLHSDHSVLAVKPVCPMTPPPFSRQDLACLHRALL